MISQAASKSMPWISQSRRINSQTETAGWVSFSWIATLSGNTSSELPCCTWRRRMSCSDAEQKKYSWRRRSSWPAEVASAG
ncbi:hypothetical protein D3C87_2028620 [compost metagenome]